VYTHVVPGVIGNSDKRATSPPGDVGKSNSSLQETIAKPRLAIRIAENQRRTGCVFIILSLLDGARGAGAYLQTSGVSYQISSTVLRLKGKGG
jgi:hypothetical protein